MELNSM